MLSSHLTGVVTLQTLAGGSSLGGQAPVSSRFITSMYCTSSPATSLRPNSRLVLTAPKTPLLRNNAFGSHLQLTPRHALCGMAQTSSVTPELRHGYAYP